MNAAQRRRRIGRASQDFHAASARRPTGPLAGYTRPQRRVIRALDREADQRHYSGRRGRTLRLSGYETGITESMLRNLSYGDGSSVNWRQETASSYPNVDRMNLRGSVDRYFDEAEAAYHKGIKPAQLSQAVQRSAFPGRYAEHGKQALDILAATRRINWPGGTTGGASGSGATPGHVERGAVEPGGTGILELVRALEERQQQPVSSTPIPSPDFAAGPVMPKGYQPVESGPPPPEPTSLADLMGLVAPGGDLPGSTFVPGSPGSPGSPAGAPGGGGHFAHLPNYGPHGGRDVDLIGHPLDRPGASTHSYVLHAVNTIADILGSPIELGTGTQHNQFTTNGNVSAHWDGRAIDLPSRGKRLMAIGRSALIAAGMDPHEARKAGAGLYNINGWQIIFGTNSPALGGDHTDHVHVQPPKGWRRPRRWR